MLAYWMMESFKHVNTRCRDKKLQEEAWVISVRAGGVKVLVPRYGIESNLRITADDSEEARKSFVYDDEVHVVYLVHSNWVFPHNAILVNCL